MQEKVIAFIEPVAQGQLFQNGYVLLAVGPVVEGELSQVGRDLDEWLINDVSVSGGGIMVWEGVCENAWCMNHGADWEPRLKGQWRPPTANELWSLRASKASPGV